MFNVIGGWLKVKVGIREILKKKKVTSCNALL